MPRRTKKEDEIECDLMGMPTFSKMVFHKSSISNKMYGIDMSQDESRGMFSHTIVESLQDALMEQYCGRQVSEPYAGDGYVEEEEILSAVHETAEEYPSEDDKNEYEESPAAMGISVELDEDGRIAEVWISFRALSWDGDFPVEEEPESYFSYEQCFDAAQAFIENILA